MILCERLGKCSDESGMSDASLRRFVQSLSELDKGGPVHRIRAWLLNQRRLGIATPRTETTCRSHNLLPTHLPDPSLFLGGALPKNARARARQAKRKCTLLIVEWLLASYAYFELGCVKSSAVLESRLGPWCTSPIQDRLIRQLFEGILSLCSLKGEALGRGRLSFFVNLNLLKASQTRIGSDFAPSNMVAQTGVPHRISLPTTAGLRSPEKWVSKQELFGLLGLNRIVLPEDQWPDPLPK